ncbi:MAG: protein tyrosine phosphatase [Rhizobiales bacterium]|nr:protein tyrosine phosphatase [Hyphomicrobiales bacterium]
MSEPDMMPELPAINASRHLQLVVNDIVAPADGLIAPDVSHAKALVEFALEWDRSSPIVIHCFAGISRSTAAALIFLCALAPGAGEQLIAKSLRAASPHAAPNRLLVEHGDRALGRDGRMLAALDAMGTPELAPQGQVFAVPLPRADNPS